MPTTPKKIPELTQIPTPTAGDESDIQTVVARQSTFGNFKMTLAQIFTLATTSGPIKTALDGLSSLIAGNTSSINTLSSTKLNKAWELRTGLTPNRIMIVDASGNETVLSGADNQYVWFQWGIPTSKTPDAKITGEIRLWSTDTAPGGWLVCDGSAVSRSTYSALFTLLGTTYGSWDGSTTFNVPDLQGRIPVGKQASVSNGTAAITLASPWVVTLSGHGLANGNKVYLTTTGTLPTGLTANTRYYVVNATLNTFRLSLTLWWSAINTSWTQSGVHTLFSANFDTIGSKWGEINHTLSTDEMPSHNHNLVIYGTWSSQLWIMPTNQNNWSTYANRQTDGAWGGLTHNNLQPYLTLNYIIAY